MFLVALVQSTPPAKPWGTQNRFLGLFSLKTSRGSDDYPFCDWKGRPKHWLLATLARVLWTCTEHRAAASSLLFFTIDSGRWFSGDQNGGVL